MFPSCPRNNGSCGEVTVSHIKECNNPTPSLGGRNCLCSGFSSVVVTNCTGLTATVTKECSPRSCKLCFEKYLVKSILLQLYICFLNFKISQNSILLFCR